MKKAELLFTTVLVPLDFAVLFLAGLTSYQIRFWSIITEIRPVIFALSIDKFILTLLAVIPLWLIIFAINGLYSFKRRKLSLDLGKIFISCSVAALVIVVAFFFNTELFSSRFIILAAWGFTVIYISLERVIIHFIRKSFYRKGLGAIRLVLVGGGQTALDIKQGFSNNPTFGFQVVKEFLDWSPATISQLDQLINDHQVDEIIYTKNASIEELTALQDYCTLHYLNFKYAAPLNWASSGRMEFDFVANQPLMTIKATPLDGWGRVIKRLFDIIVAIILLIILSPILVIIAVLIKIDSRGPIFYLDYRSGQYNKRFIFYKFRSMVAELCDGEGPSATTKGNEMLKSLASDEQYNTRGIGPLHKIKNDPRVTKIGKFIRRWSLDELPQLINVLKGDLSLVGPRPHMTIETAKYEAHHKKVLTIKPGITGLAQISGRSDLAWDQEVTLDLYYIANWSLALDLQILLKTPLAVLRRRKTE